ncbi:MAG: dTDP-glucose 4,6-dehydratase [Candidatus Neomarinimicrobiota bacterium]|nr:dTDP-glucose 4,6-dehydratase [Candidatus Neomarinimicrobiota bacterium]
MNNNILVTGGSGFIGSNFIQYIINHSDYKKIINLDKLTYAGNSDNLINIENDPRYKFVKGDICNRDFINKIFHDYKPITIVHFAAESHVDRSIDGPKDFIDTNIIGTYNLLQESLNIYSKLNKESKSFFKFHHISTDEVFGSLGRSGYFTEDTAYDPSSPYSASKASSDHLVRAWHRTFGLPITISNCSNNYGPYQFPEKLIPLMIINCLSNKQLPVYGKGDNVRDWLYVEDHCKAIDLILKDGAIGETYNIGGNNEIKNIKIVKSICSILDTLEPAKSLKQYSDLITFVSDRPGHDFRYSIDTTKIKNELNWGPEESFDTGLLKTIKWYLDNEIWWKKIQNHVYNQERLGIES